MSMYAYPDSEAGKDGEKRPVTVPLPNAYAGIASSLKAAYAALPMDEQFHRLLSRIK